MQRFNVWIVPFALLALGGGSLALAQPRGRKTLVRGRVVDADSGQTLPARIYLQSAKGAWLHVTAPQGTAIPYRKQRGASREIHTTVSAHPFAAELPPGRYELTVERGKEYPTLVRSIDVQDGKPLTLRLPLRRWTHMARRGWYSGDTHVHRKLSELPNLVLAEDLNVALPLTSWVTDSRQSPRRANKNPEPLPPAKLIEVDAEHVIWPINTEYEIFTVNGKRHTLGALFVLNHRQPLEPTAPPVGPIAAAARRQGKVLLDMDKHNWPWSMMLPPVTGVELFELTNNHVWRTRFAFKSWYEEYAAPYMRLELDERGEFTERGWIDFGFENYYSLLNCGFSMQPSAGTASGVHPVPLGFGRVYVQLPKEQKFSYPAWIEGLRRGRSFVTTGPLLTATFNGRPHGARFDAGTAAAFRLNIAGQAESPQPLGPIEVVQNGRVVETIQPQAVKTERGAYRAPFQADLKVTRSCWVALRCFEKRRDGRPRFAHTSPTHIRLADRPLRPRPAEVKYLIRRIEDELDRHREVLPKAALEEYERAKAAYGRRLMP